MKYRITRIYQPEGACRPDRSDRVAVIDAETPRAAAEAYQRRDERLKDWTIEEKQDGAVLLNPVVSSDPVYTASVEEPPKPWEPKRKEPPADTDASGGAAGDGDLARGIERVEKRRQALERPGPDPTDSEGGAHA